MSDSRQPIPKRSSRLADKRPMIAKMAKAGSHCAPGVLQYLVGPGREDAGQAARPEADVGLAEVDDVRPHVRPAARAAAGGVSIVKPGRSDGGIHIRVVLPRRLRQLPVTRTF